VQGFASPGSRASAFGGGEVGLSRWSHQPGGKSSPGDKFGDEWYTPPLDQDAVPPAGVMETSFVGSPVPTSPYDDGHEGAVISNPLFGMEEEDLQEALTPPAAGGAETPPPLPASPELVPEPPALSLSQPTSPSAQRQRSSRDRASPSKRVVSPLVPPDPQACNFVEKCTSYTSHQLFISASYPRRPPYPLVASSSPPHKQSAYFSGLTQQSRPPCNC